MAAGDAVDGSERLTWLATDSVPATCPNCGATEPKRPVLAAQLLNAQEPGASTTLLACGACGCGFFQLPALVDYAREPAGGSAALAFYLQQGAGLWSIDSALLRLGLPPGRSMLEVGCGFGFGLDFALHALGWRVRGLDPSPFARTGRQLLSLPIEHRHLIAGEDCGGPYDVIMASELLEHVPDPRALLATMRQALEPGGVLVLSTPNFGWVQPETPPGLLTPLLSAGYHIVLQTEASLRAALCAVGFATVDVEAAGAQLVARATDGAAGWQSGAIDRERYRRYLTDAMSRTLGHDDLWLGFAARAFREAILAGDKLADRIFDQFSGVCRDRYGFEVDQWQAPMRSASLSLEDLVSCEPLCLGPVLVHRGLQRLAAGESRSSLRLVFEQAAMATGRLRQALQRIGTDDGDAEDLEWVARAEAALCAAHQGAGEVPQLLAALGRAPSHGPGDQSLERLRRRCFVELVNAGHYEGALALVDAVPSIAPAPDDHAPLLDDELDALFCGGVLDVQHPDGDLRRALARAAALRECCRAALTAGRTGVSPRVLLWPALRLELLALRKLGDNEGANQLHAAQLPRLSLLPGAEAPPADLAIPS